MYSGDNITSNKKWLSWRANVKELSSLPEAIIDRSKPFIVYVRTFIGRQ